MLTLLTRLRIKPFVLGIDWQADHLRAVLLRFANKANTPTDRELLGQWCFSLPMGVTAAPIQFPAAWQDFISQTISRLGSAPLQINVGIPNQLCTWLHCPEVAPLKYTNLIALQLHYQRIAAAALNAEPANLCVCHLRLAPNFSFLVVTKRHYEERIGHFIMSVHDAIQGSVVGGIEPQGYTQVFTPSWVDDAYGMAWFMADKTRPTLC